MPWYDILGRMWLVGGIVWMILWGMRYWDRKRAMEQAHGELMMIILAFFWPVTSIVWFAAYLRERYRRRRLTRQRP